MLLAQLAEWLLFPSGLGSPVTAHLQDGAKVQAESPWGEWKLDLALEVREPKDLDTQTPIGLRIGWRPANAPLEWVLGYSASDDQEDAFTISEASVRMKTRELSVGVRHSFRTETHFQPSLAAGVAWLHEDVRIEEFFAPVIEGSDDSFGVWLEGGITWQWMNGFRLGAGARAFFGSELDIGGQSYDPTYTQLAVVSLGYRF